jgi:hypothetical protein
MLRHGATPTTRERIWATWTARELQEAGGSAAAIRPPSNPTPPRHPGQGRSGPPYRGNRHAWRGPGGRDAPAGRCRPRPPASSPRPLGGVHRCPLTPWTRLSLARSHAPRVSSAPTLSATSTPRRHRSRQPAQRAPRTHPGVLLIELNERLPDAGKPVPPVGTQLRARPAAVAAPARGRPPRRAQPAHGRTARHRRSAPLARGHHPAAGRWPDHPRAAARLATCARRGTLRHPGRAGTPRDGLRRSGLPA